MSYADPSALVNAVKAGASFASGLLDDGSGEPKRCKLVVDATGVNDKGDTIVTASHWELDANEGLLLKSRKMVQILADCTVIVEAGEYQFAVDTSVGRRHVAVDPDDPERVTLADP